MSENEEEKTLLPPNYVSLAHLQERWLKQKQLDEEENEQKRIQQSKEAQQQRQPPHQEKQNNFRGFSGKVNTSRKDKYFDPHMQKKPVKSRNGYHQVKAKASKEDNLEEKGISSGALGRNSVVDEGYDGKFHGKVNGCAVESVSAEVWSGKMGFRGGDRRSKIGDAEELEGMGEGWQVEENGKNMGLGTGIEEKGRWGRGSPWNRDSGDQRRKVKETEKSERMGKGSEMEKTGRHVGSIIGSEEKSDKHKRGRQGCRGPSNRNSGDERSKVGEVDESERMGEDLDGELNNRVTGLGIVNEEKSENREKGRQRYGGSSNNREKGRQRYRGSSKSNGGEKRSNAGAAEALERNGEGLERENKGRIWGSAIGNKEKGKYQDRGRKGSSGPLKRNDSDQGSNVREIKELEQMGEGLEGEKKGSAAAGIGNDEKGKNQGMGRKVSVGYRFRGNWVRQESNGMKVRVDFPTEVYKKNESAEGTLVVVSEISEEKNGCGCQESEKHQMVNQEVPVSSMEGKGLGKRGKKLGAVKETADAGTMARQRNIPRLRYKGGYQCDKNVSVEKIEEGFEELPLNDEKTVKARRRSRTDGHRGSRNNHMYCNNRMHRRIDSGLMWVKKGVISDANMQTVTVRAAKGLKSAERSKQKERSHREQQELMQQGQDNNSTA